jgi:hypothetical protein
MTADMYKSRGEPGVAPPAAEARDADGAAIARDATVTAGGVAAMRHAVAVEAQLLAALARVAATRGVSTETLVNLWLQEKVRSLPAAHAGHHGYG